jgi:ribosomal protein S18 acetylase RimI-like enzyme
MAGEVLQISIEAIANQAELFATLEMLDPVFPHQLSAQVQDLDQYAEKLWNHAILLVARKNHHVIAFCAMYANDFSTRQAYLAQLVVAQSNQGSGVGQALLTRAIEIAKERSMTSLKLEVFNDNPQAIGFYKKNGFLVEEVNHLSQFMVKPI